MKRKNHQMQKLMSRTGISLMEVLISIGVVSIGLLGVVSLIPVASHQAEQGARNDRRANVGRRSFREFVVRGFDDAGSYDEPNWYDDDGTDGNDIVFNSAAGAQEYIPRPLCIDPRYVAANFAPFTANGNSLPLGSMSSVAMPTTTLAIEGVPFPNPMQAAHADEVFVFRDDLEFELPESNGDSPTQTFLNTDADGDGLVDDPSKRYAKGQFSWFFTVFPNSGAWSTVSTVLSKKSTGTPRGSYGSFSCGVCTN